jgi:dTDP-4-dehydrorhamnose reductase
MVTVAVAGGTGQLGLTIVEVLKQNSSLRVIALSRKVRVWLLVTTSFFWVY